MPCMTIPVVHSTPDGGFVVCSGQYQSNVATHLQKFNKCGVLQWTREYPGIDPGDMVVGRRGNIFLCNMYGWPQIAKLDSLGNMLWHQTYNSGGYSNYVYSMGEFSNGDLFFNGITDMLMNGPYYNFVVKTDSNGTIKWSKRYADIPAWGMGTQCSDGGVLSRTGDLSFKTDSLGNLEWSKEMPETSFSYKPIEVSNGFVFAKYGETSFNYPDTGFIYKLDRSGNIVWAGQQFSARCISSVIQLPNGHFLTAGSIRKDSATYNFMPILTELDSTGNFVQQFSYRFPDSTASSVWGVSVCNLTNGSFIFAGRDSYSYLDVCKTSFRYKMGCGDSSIHQFFSPPNIHVYHNYSLSATDFPFTMVSAGVGAGTISPVENLRCESYDSVMATLPIAVCFPGDSLILSAPAGYSYSWSNGDTLSSTVVYSPGSYSVAVMDACAGFFVTLSINVLGCAGTSSFAKADQVLVYPNPTNGQIKVVSGTEEKCVLKVFTCLGDELGRETFYDETEYDLSCRPKGIYILEIAGDNLHTRKRVIFN